MAISSETHRSRSTPANCACIGFRFRLWLGLGIGFRDRDRVRVRDRDRVKKSLAARPPLTSCVATLDEMPAAPEEPADPRGNESSRLPGWSTASDSATLGRH